MEDKKIHRKKQKGKALDNKMKKVRNWEKLDKIPVVSKDKPEFFITKHIKGIWGWIKRKW